MSLTQDVYIASVARTPIGSFRGSLSTLSATQLGSIVIKSVLEKANITGDNVDEVYIGNVYSAGLGQGPARQAALAAGVSVDTPCTTVNKLCASGMKSVMICAKDIKWAENDVMIAGGLESMSNVPYYLKRGETPYGGITLSDGILIDGLTDPFNNLHVGACAENLAKEYKLSREEQDNYAIESYKRTELAHKRGLFQQEIIPVSVKKAREVFVTVDTDEEFSNVDYNRIKTLRPVFIKENGTITAANASSLSDGAAACLLMSAKAVEKFSVKPLAKIIGMADAATRSIDFGIAPAIAIRKILKKTNIEKSQIAHWEINEAFSAIALANIKELALDPKLVNPNGGAVALGHPVGFSGTRIVNHLAINLKPGEYGMAAICNGGGGASALLIKKL